MLPLGTGRSSKYHTWGKARCFSLFSEEKLIIAIGAEHIIRSLNAKKWFESYQQKRKLSGEASNHPDILFSQMLTNISIFDRRKWVAFLLSSGCAVPHRLTSVAHPELSARGPQAYPERLAPRILPTLLPGCVRITQISGDPTFHLQEAKFPPE